MTSCPPPEKLKDAEDSAEDEECELEDPLETARAYCGEKDKAAKSLFERLEECNDRVNSKTKTAETCLEEMIDWVEALDACVVGRVFCKLK